MVTFRQPTDDRKKLSAAEDVPTGDRAGGVPSEKQLIEGTEHGKKARAVDTTAGKR